MNKSSPEAALARMLGMPQIDHDDEDKHHPDPDAVIMDLKGICERYVAGCPFEVGDIVTPRAAHAIWGTGLPAIVVEIAEVPHRAFTTDEPAAHSSQAWGARLDIRIAHLMRGDWCMHWAESWQYEPFTPA